MSFAVVVLLSFIEGLTEFLPISSTGHLILVSFFLGINEEGFIKSFNIIVQFGAILSVLVIYWRRFLTRNFIFYFKLFIAFLPSAVLGLLIKNKIDQILGSVQTVAWSLIIGGGILIVSDWFFPSDDSIAKENPSHFKSLDELSYKNLLSIGFLQCLAFIPGVSRAAASILGGLLYGLTRKEATEFSFFLAVPTLAGATFIKSLPLLNNLDTSQLKSIGLGISLSFIFALLAIQYFIKFVSRHGFKYFGLYRITLGLFILLYLVTVSK